MKFNLIGKIVLLLSIGILVSTASLIYFISGKQKTNAVETAAYSAKATIEQFKSLRAYYTENVVKKAKAAGVKIDFEHKEKDGVIPLPATMIHELGEILNAKEGGLHLNLYSSFPFPVRQGRVLDAVSNEALEAIQKNPDEAFVKVVTENDISKVRVAIADKMGESCVACHNSHALSPKKDWKVGDVRGVLEVSIPLTAQLKASQDMVWSIGWSSTLGALALIGLIVLVLWKGTIQPFQNTVGQIRSTANNTDDISLQVSAASDTVAANSSEQAAAVQTTTESFQQLMVAVEKKVESATKASELSKINKDTADRGVIEIERLVVSIGEVSQSSKRIQDISTLIDDISFQTNLLALNAAVEAARAGEQGRGFAVVADAVRSLAQKSAAEAKNIADIVADNSTKSSRSLEIAKSNGAILTEIVSRAVAIATLVEEIVLASRAEAETLGHLSHSMEQIQQAAQSNAASSEETTASMASLANEIKALRTMTDDLQSLIGRTSSQNASVTEFSSLKRDSKDQKAA
jgi:methyl-accepting chemotaxis protein